MSSKVKIYELIDPLTGLTRYIGKTTQSLKSRFSSHLYNATKGLKTPLYNWIRKLLSQDLEPIMSVIDEVEVEWTEFWEQFYIDLYRSWNFKLTNLKSGGIGGNHNEITKQKIKLNNSRYWLNRHHSEESKEKMRVSAINRANIPFTSRPVLQLDKDGKIIKEFRSVTNAINVTNIKGIRNVADKCNRTAGGYTWKYKIIKDGKL